MMGPKNDKKNYNSKKIRNLPKEWKMTRLENACEKIKAGGTPSTKVDKYWNGNIPFVKIEDITASGKYISTTKTSITEEGLKASNAWLVPRQTLLLAMYGSMGEVTITKREVTTNQAILGIIADTDGLDTEFLYYWLLWFKPNWKRYAKPTTQANLTAEIVKNIRISLPPLPEQRRIARVLGTVDSAIEKTDAMISHTERLKRGLMQKLLTRGIGHEEFKDTEIGRIPAEWEVVRLGDVIDLENGKRPEQISDVYKIPIYGAGGIMGFTKRYISNQNFNVVIGRVGVGSAGKVYLVSGKAWFSDNTIYSKSYEIEKIYIPYAYYFLKLKPLNRHLSRSGAGGYAIIAQSALRNLKLPLPPLPEQEKIAEILGTVDKKLELLRARRERLERVKRGLMNDLLTGRKRVPAGVV